MDDLDRLVARAALPVARPTDQTLAQALTAMATAICDNGSPRRGFALEVRSRRRRLRRRTVAAGLTIMTAVAAPVAAATIIAAHTGHYGDGGEEGTGEFIRLDSPEFPQVLDQIRHRENLPLPAGEDWNGLAHRYDGVEGPTNETTSGIAFDVELYAQCAWQGAFVDAVHSGETQLQQRAAAVLNQVPSWPQMAAQSDPTFQSTLRAEADAANRGDAGTADHATPGQANIAWDYAVNCTDKQPGQ